MRNPKSPRRKLRRGNKEWAELIRSRLTPEERRELYKFVMIPHTRLDFAWWLTRTLNPLRKDDL